MSENHDQVSVHAVDKDDSPMGRPSFGVTATDVYNKLRITFEMVLRVPARGGA